MATLYSLKPWFQDLLAPYADRIDEMGYTADQVTWAGLVVSALGGLLVWLSGAHWLALLLFPVFLAARMALNAIDGVLARKDDRATPEGALLNELSDVAADALLYLPFAVAAGLSPVIVGLAVAAGIAVEMAGVLAQTVGTQRRYDGPFGKSDRALFWAVVAVLMAIGLGGAWMNLLLVAAIALSVWTCVNRCAAALDEPR